MSEAREMKAPEGEVPITIRIEWSKLAGAYRAYVVKEGDPLDAYGISRVHALKALGEFLHRLQVLNSGSYQ